MQTIYFILQGKGGVEKIHINSFLMQYLQEKFKIIIHIPGTRNQSENDTLNSIDLKQMSKSKSIFSEIELDEIFSLTTKQRLKIYKEKTFNTIELLGVLK